MESPGTEVATPCAPALTMFCTSLSWPSGAPPCCCATLSVTPEIVGGRLRAIDDLLDEGVALRVGDEPDRNLVVGSGGGSEGAESKNRVTHARCLPIDINVSSARFLQFELNLKGWVTQFLSLRSPFPQCAASSHRRR